MTQDKADLQHLAEIIKDIRVAMMTTFPTNPTEHFCHTRPMHTQRVDPQSFTGELVFLTDDHTGKVREIANEDRVLLTYADPVHNRFVSVLGRALTERDPIKVRELWNLMLKAWWPAGPDDPSIVVLRVRVESAEYWDGPSNALFTLRVLKSLVTGKPMNDAMRQPDASAQNHKTIILH
ncbi:MAG: pyridoxamine 5'-phosphate oxidase family protein [Phycisphaerales bacterium]|nr:pyridoxamine 5'-phosphate oxidase family protein [Phycisphaerales bacterium]